MKIIKVPKLIEANRMVTTRVVIVTEEVKMKANQKRTVVKKINKLCI